MNCWKTFISIAKSGILNTELSEMNCPLNFTAFLTRETKILLAVSCYMRFASYEAKTACMSMRMFKITYFSFAGSAGVNIFRWAQTRDAT